MKNQIKQTLTSLILLSALNSTVFAQGTAFTYQGQLQNNGSPASGTYNLTFTLFDTNTSGAPIVEPVTNNAVVVANGQFTVLIDFGPGVFTGPTNWLQIGVETNGDSSFTTLTPRQELTPTPYAIYAESANTLSGTLSASELTSIGNTTDINAQNFFIGFAGNSTTGGAANTAAGYMAFNENTGGSDNTAYGFQALVDNTSGSGNTGIGLTALAANSSGIQNTAVGEEAMYMGGSSMGGSCSDNSAFGVLALGNNQGSFNLASGVYALYGNGLGSYNTANGAFALYSNGGTGNGNYNTANGYEALYSGGTGGSNVADGALALYSSVTGGNNIALGHQAGYYITSGSSNIDIGNPGLPTDTNLIRIGTGQTQTFIAGVINGNGAGLTNLNVMNFSGTLPLTQLPVAVVTNTESNVSLGSLTLGSSLVLSAPAAVYSGGNSLLIADNDFDFYAGPLAGNFTTTGPANTGLGFGALSMNGGGAFNAAVGAGALGKNSVGNNNTALGYEALYNNSTGSNNVANGYWALLANTSGNNNTANGYEALYDNSTGYLNTAVGYNALNNNTSGYVNTAVGHDALKLNQIGNQNVAVGDLALSAETSGNNNTAVGDSAGSSITTGSDNIDIGNIGSSADSGVIRIGTPGKQTQTYIAGTIQSLTCNTITITGGADLAEPFPISTADQKVSEGAVVVIDETNPGQLKLTDQPYDTRVAGVISGANGIHPGIQMQQHDLLEGGKNVALTGRVYVQADASNGPIKPGDLLTTSSTPGEAMKVTDHVRAQGATLGKAMTALRQGKGMVLVLVTLQ